MLLDARLPTAIEQLVAPNRQKALVICGANHLVSTVRYLVPKCHIDQIRG